MLQVVAKCFNTGDYPAKAASRCDRVRSKRSLGAIVLLVASAIAVVLANTWLSTFYYTLLDTPVGIRVGTLALEKPLGELTSPAWAHNAQRGPLPEGLLELMGSRDRWNLTPEVAGPLPFWLLQLAEGSS